MYGENTFDDICDETWPIRAGNHEENTHPVADPREATHDEETAPESRGDEGADNPCTRGAHGGIPI